ncbi:MAG: peptidase MA family metallohydrolase [Candidatus Omnitrophica bacterium]|nr:peptidase MA family metallohydrolase [Candidatus Omnitrophota bacterium]
MSIKLFTRICRVAVVLPALFAFSAGLQTQAADFEKLEKGHFVIYHNNRDLANDLIWKAEYYYKKILGHFGVAEFRPWTGKDKCEIYLYKTKADYMKATGAPEWSGGQAQFSPLRFSAFENSRNLKAAVFPHELTHMLFHLFMDKKRMPLWLEEGMAQFEEEDQTSLYRQKQFIKQNIKGDTYIKLSELTGIQAVPEDNVELFYAESASVVAHLITDNIRTSYGKFLTYLKNGDSTDTALKKSYQWKYKNGVNDLEIRWLEFVKRKY